MNANRGLRSLGQLTAGLAMVGFLPGLAGCQSQPAGDSDIDPPVAMEAELTAETAQRDAPLPGNINNPAAALDLVERLPLIDDPETRLEIALHAALYRAALEASICEFTDHYLLEPLRWPEDDPIKAAMTIEQTERRVRTLAALADLGVPTAYTYPRDSGAESGLDTFPGTRRLATRLQVRIVSRAPDHATVTAEIGDRTQHAGGSRQRVLAMWDGQEWVIRREGARLVW